MDREESAKLLSSTFFNLNHENVYDMFRTYFGNCPLVKVADRDEKTSRNSVYATKIKTMLLNSCRYLIVIKSRDFYPIGTTTPFSKIDWECLQTRSFPSDPYPGVNVPTWAYTPKSNPSNIVTEIEMKSLSSQTKDGLITYTSRLFPIQIDLINNSKSNYAKKGTIMSALETYSTIVTLL